MADRLHRTATQDDLHRIERTGAGNPNTLTIADVIDGQYFQDTLTGSVYRYNGSTSQWEILIQYDRTTGRITNTNQATFTRTNKVGNLTSAITTSPITSIPARLVVALQEGEDIKIISSADETKTISLTLTSDISSGDVSIPVQSTITGFTFPLGSTIIVEDGLRGVYTSVDPNRIQSRIDVEHAASSIGEVSADILIGDTSVTSIPLTKIEPVVRLADGKRLILTNNRGESQVVIVDGDQVISAKQASVTVQAFDASYDYEVGKCFLYEPSYEATSRITQTESSILLQASQISDLSNSTASLNIAVADNAANITLLSSVNDSQNSSISTLEANASAQQATLALLASVNDTQNSSIAGINIDVSNLQSSVNTSVQYNNVGAYIQLLAGPAGSEIELQANQINIDGIVTFLNEDINVTTTIDGDKITTGTIGASQINTTSLFAQTINIDEGNISFFDGGSEVIRLGEDSGNTGLFLYDIGGAQLSSFKSDGLIIGSDDSDVWNAYAESWNVSPDFNNYQYASFDPENGLIVRGRISANDIVSGTLSADLIVGQVVKNETYTPNVSGYAIFSNGFAEFETVKVRGELITGSGSQIDGFYASNINAGTIVVGTLSADRIGANTITASKIDVDDLFAETITIQSGGSISGSNFTLNDTGGNIAGWIIEADTLKSSSSGARIELNKGDNRVSVFDGVGEKAAMGYLEGLPKNDASGNWTSSDYGFWAKNGDRLVIDGDIEYDSGDWLIQNDASYKVLDGSATPKEIIRLGTASGQKGLFIYDDNVTTTSNTDSGITYTTGDVIAKFVATGFYVGDNTSSNYIEYDQSAGELTVRGTLNASDIISGSIDANVITVSNIDASQITSGSIDANVITVSNLNASEIITGSIDANVITVSNLNASQIITGTIDADRINTDALFAESVSVSNTITIGSSGQITNADDDFKIDNNGFSVYPASVSVSGPENEYKFQQGSTLFGGIREFIELIPVGLGFETEASMEIFTSNADSGRSKITLDTELVRISEDINIAGELEVTGNSTINSILIQLDNIPTSAPATPNCVWVDASGFLRLS